LHADDVYLFPIDIEASFCPNPSGENAILWRYTVKLCKAQRKAGCFAGFIGHQETQTCPAKGGCRED
jgi:hypothetical protein